MEVLAARYRLGEQLWTFHSRQARVLSQLAEKGLVTTMHGVTDNTVRARLTDRGKAQVISPTYVAPVFEKKRPCPQDSLGGMPCTRGFGHSGHCNFPHK